MTPSKLRRQGRNAFYPGGNPREECPYRDFMSFYGVYNRTHWLEGWREAEVLYEQAKDIPRICECCGQPIPDGGNEK